jgi:hypothetical protein
VESLNEEALTASAEASVLCPNRPKSPVIDAHPLREGITAA